MAVASPQVTFRDVLDCTSEHNGYDSGDIDDAVRRL